jgi:hypothetical protein
LRNPAATDAEFLRQFGLADQNGHGIAF